jgi:hypothetical protein
MLDLISAFIGELRGVGVPVSLTESLDALQALQHAALADRSAVRSALGATLVKDQVHRAPFDLLFDIYFGSAAAAEIGVAADPGPVSAAPADRRAARPTRLGTLSREDLGDALVAALRSDDRPTIEAIATEAVTRYATIQPARPMTVSYYVYRTLRGLDLAARLAATSRPPARTGSVPVSQRLAAVEHGRRLGYLRSKVQAEVLRRLVAAQGPAAIAGTVRKPLPENIEFLRASPADLEAMQAALEPMIRRLTARLTRRGRPRGTLDPRATMRRSLSYGGVLAEPAFRQRRRVKPEIIVLADVSGSVAAFARFTFLLVRAVSANLSRFRGFIFVDTIEEVTSLIAASQSVLDLAGQIDRGARAVSADGHSDYGNVLETFWARCGRDVNQRTTVLVLGDARNNRRLPATWVLREVSGRAGHLFWLNPEPRAQWNTGDSVMAEYAPYCDTVAECRNLWQLENFVTSQLLKPAGHARNANAIKEST